VTDPIEQAALAALAGRLVVLPTDTVYGIGTRPDDATATTRLFEAKGRPAELTLPVLVPTTAAAREIAAFDDRADALALAFWAGPLTLVLPRTAASRGWELGGDPGTVGVRMPIDAPLLSDEQIQMIADWVKTGAFPDVREGEH